jgi:hypothetical protein
MEQNGTRGFCLREEAFFDWSVNLINKFWHKIGGDLYLCNLYAENKLFYR